ncbi:MAG: single-stranded DNA-binding protein [Bacteroidales bacterium]|nr:single-stranded DNA-binding protein [Bacteroidales bacterium]
MALNKVMLIGNVGNDPEVRYLESNPQNPATNAKVASFRLATTERFRDRNGELRENTEWHSIVAWRSNADLAEKFIHKGSQIYIEGKLRTRQWTDQTGAKRFTTEVVADTIQLLGKRPEGEQQQGGYQGGYAPAPGYSAPAPATGYGAPAGAPVSAPAPVSVPAATPAPAAAPAAPVAAPAAPAQQASPDYQGPLPAAEPSDDLPF